ncbi:MAG: ATP-binding protein [Thiolinea sp.]
MSEQVRQSRKKHLSHRFILFLFTVLGSVSACFLVVFYFYYDAQLTDERIRASASVSTFLKSSLEQAMLRRDLDGLREAVEGLGAQDEIRQVFITDTRGEVRFSSRKEWLGEQASDRVSAVCAECLQGSVPEEPVSSFIVTDAGQELLRTVLPVRNKPQCVQCHGDPVAHPVNGLLVVDYDALPIRQKNLSNIVLLAVAGSSVMLLAAWGAWGFMRRNVLSPVDELNHASYALSRGDLDAQVRISGNDEMSDLAETFNKMAGSLRNAQKVLISREQFLQGVIDALPDGVRVIDPFYQIVVANHSYAQLAGVGSAETLRQQYCYKVTFRRDTPCPPSLRTCPLHELKDGQQAGKYIENLQRADGSVKTTEVYAALLNIADGSGGNEQLVVEAVRDQGAVVRYSHEQKLSALGELAAGVAHEIHNPLASIRIALDASGQILDTRNDDGTDELQEYLGLVDEQVKHCLEVTRRLMKLGTLANSYSELVEVNVVCSDILSLLRFEREQHGISVELDLQPDRLRILAAESDFHMIMLNLVQNAFHAMADGGTLCVMTRREYGSIAVRVKDTGSGIAEDVLPYIFEPFFSRRSDQKGSGLGLAIVRSLVQQHGGTVKVEEHDPGNTVFKLEFPDADRIDEEEV